MQAKQGSIAWGVQQAYGQWFDRLQSLTILALDPDDWTGCWYDGLTPEQALAAGPDHDRESRLQKMN